MTDDISDIWVYLPASPPHGLTVTPLAYQGACRPYLRSCTATALAMTLRRCRQDGPEDAP